MVKVDWVAALGYSAMAFMVWGVADAIYVEYFRRTRYGKDEHKLKIRGPASAGVKFGLKILGYDV